MRRLVSVFLCLIAFIAMLVAGHPAVAAPPSVKTRRDVQGLVIYAPEPQYPFQALQQYVNGAGIFVLRVQIASGRVKEVMVARSTGHAVLDRAAVNTLKRWRFKPGALLPSKDILPHVKDPLAADDSLVKVPITFTINFPR